MLKNYTKTGINCIQLRSFNEKAYFQRLSDTLTEFPGLTADRLAAHLKINVIVMKEQIQQALEMGYLCLDESHEGLRYYPNLILSYAG